VRAALAAMCLGLPPKRVLVNLAPADLIKKGSHVDLPIALGVLTEMDILPIEEMTQLAALASYRSMAGWHRSPASCRRRLPPRRVVSV